VSYNVEVTVKSVKGTCDFSHKVGDIIRFDGKSIKGDICYSALMVLLPYIFSMRYGAEFPWAEDKDATEIACPDPETQVVFGIRRIRK